MKSISKKEDITAPFIIEGKRINILCQVCNDYTIADNYDRIISEELFMFYYSNQKDIEFNMYCRYSHTNIIKVKRAKTFLEAIIVAFYSKYSISEIIDKKMKRIRFV